MRTYCRSSGSGKSTLALVLSQNGFNFLADDDCFVKLTRRQPKLFPFCAKAGLNERILRKYPELRKHTLKNCCYSGKHRISLNFISSDPNKRGAFRCKMIIFPKYKAKRKIFIKKISKEEALDRLVKAHPVIYKEKEFPKKFWTLYYLTNKASSFELIYNDDKLNDIPKIIQKIF